MPKNYVAKTRSQASLFKHNYDNEVLIKVLTQMRAHACTNLSVN